ncbi:chitodextrinase [Paenibacillus mucilaginosus]|uniref:fibronectin type III domain-containing protein n=1 Tax=Paenibacillus mucilaginosus TaxID=61624 RepID=UPI003D1E3830
MRHRNKLGLFALLLLLWMLPLYATADTGVKVEILTPAESEILHGEVFVAARVTSDYDIQSVTATVEDQSVTLTKVCEWSDNCEWRGNLSLAGVSQGTHQLVVTALDYKNRTGQASLPILQDEVPGVQIFEPLSGVTVGTQLHLRAEATDDGAPPVLQVYLGVDKILEGTGAVDQTIDLSAYAGRQVHVSVWAVDSSGQTAWASVQLHVEAGDEASLMDQVPGVILDFDENRTLYLTKEKELRLKDRKAGDDRLISVLNLNGTASPQAALLAGGAVFSQWEPEGEVFADHLYVWKDGTVSPLPLSQWNDRPSKLLLAHGNLIAYEDSEGFSHVHDAATGATTNFGRHTTVNSAPDGSLVLAQDGRLYSYKPGGEVDLLFDDRRFYFTNPFTDGKRYLYQYLYSHEYTLVLQEGDQKTTLVGFTPDQIESYALNNGWIAYRKPVNNINQLFLRSPQGEETRLTYYNEAASLYYLDKDGTVYYSYKDQLYVHRPAGGEDLLLGGIPGKGVIRKGDRWYKLAGDKVYRYDLEQASDHTAPVWPSANALTVTGVTYRSAVLEWRPADDNEGVAAYDVYLNGTLRSSVSGSVYTYTVHGLSPEASFLFSVRARDAAGNISSGNPEVTVTTPKEPPADTEGPVWPAGEVLSVSDVTYSSAVLAWRQASDDTAVSEYRLFQDGELLATVTGTTYKVTGLNPSSRYSFHLIALDASGYASQPSPALTVTTAAYSQEPGAALISLEAKPGFYEVGSTVEVYVRAKSAQDLYGFLLQVGYDRTKLRLNQTLLSKEFGVEGESAVFGKNTSALGRAAITGSLLGDTPGRTGDVKTVVLKFTLTGKGSADVVLNPGSSLADSSGREVRLTEPVRLTLTAGSADLDGDGRIGLSDLVLISRHSGASDGEPGFDARFDINGDRTVDLLDVQYVADKVTGSQA